jgi:hypothetical protein
MHRPPLDRCQKKRAEAVRPPECNLEMTFEMRSLYYIQEEVSSWGESLTAFCGVPSLLSNQVA